MNADSMESDAVRAAREFEDAFRRIWSQRMDGMALANSALQVEAVGFRRVGDALTGVLITPWSMLVVRVPDRAPLPEGRTGARALPCGDVDFVGAWLDEVGGYESCSLFSPMFQFPDQGTARAVAGEALALLMRPESPLPVAPAPAPVGDGPLAALRRNAGRDFDRRGFLRGAFLHDDADSR